ncbi:MAG: SMP-30/gluconolactonase/LRE family protein [Armatimonadota bacterium]|nr:SMP-30/gluconolactonase/LRE family protein [Armatimonadota bacterium]
MRSTAAGVVVLLVFSVAGALRPADGASAASPMVLQNVGFQTPESVLYDPVSDVYLVANINGNPTAADGNGFISRVAPSGRVAALKWIDGTRAGTTLNAPKGMAIVGDTLYVSDITAVRMFDRRTGRFEGSVEIPGATFVNDLASAPDGSVYVTDSGLKPDFSPSGTDAVYRIDRGRKLSTVAKRTALRNPNGIAVRPSGRLVVVNFSKPGEVLTLGRNGQLLDTWKLPAGQLDGVVILPDGALLVSSWEASVVYRVERGGVARVVVRDVPSPADIGYDSRRGRVLIPIFTKHQVVIQPLP